MRPYPPCRRCLAHRSASRARPPAQKNQGCGPVSDFRHKSRPGSDLFPTHCERSGGWDCPFPRTSGHSPFSEVAAILGKEIAPHWPRCQGPEGKTAVRATERPLWASPHRPRTETKRFRGVRSSHLRRATDQLRYRLPFIHKSRWSAIEI